MSRFLSSLIRVNVDLDQLITQFENNVGRDVETRETLRELDPSRPAGESVMDTMREVNQLIKAMSATNTSVPARTQWLEENFRQLYRSTCRLVVRSAWGESTHYHIITLVQIIFPNDMDDRKPMTNFQNAISLFSLYIP